MKKDVPIVELSFQDITSDQLADILPLREGRYGPLKRGLLTKIESTVSPFLFGSKSKLDDKEIHSLEQGINTFFKKKYIHWRIKYSEKAQAFACFPIKPRKTGYAVRRQIKTNTGRMDVNDFIELAEKTFKLSLEHERRAGSTALVKAICFVGSKVCGIRGSILAETLGYGDSTPSTFIQRAMTDPKAKEMVKVLTSAVQQHIGG